MSSEDEQVADVPSFEVSGVPSAKHQCPAQRAMLGDELLAEFDIDNLS